MRNPVRGLLALLAAWCAPWAAASCLWFADGTSIHQVSTDTNSIVRSVHLSSPDRLVLNARDCGVWALEREQRLLLRYDADGVLVREIAAGSLDASLERTEWLDIDPHRGMLWIAGGRRVVAIAAEGAAQAAFDAPGEILRIQAALDGSLWVLGQHALWRLGSDGALLETHDLGKQLENARLFELDELNGVAWLADENDLVRLPLLAGTGPTRIAQPAQATALALDRLTGRLWVANAASLLQYAAAGALARTVSLADLGLRKPLVLAFEPASDSLWMGTDGALVRFDDAGQAVARIEERDGRDAVGVPPFLIEPTLALLAPPAGIFTNDPRPEFRLGYGALCNGAPCGFDAPYFGGYLTTATINGAPAVPFVFDAASAQARFAPAQPIPDGRVDFLATARDPFGHLSNTVTTTFTIDTVPPKFVALDPADGATVTSAAIVISGNVDEEATVSLGNAAALQLTGPAVQGAAFAFSVTLQPGINTITLAATDRAGNRTSTTLHITLAPPLEVVIRSPVDGETVAGSTVTVSGTFRGPANVGITVNDAPAAVSGSQFFAVVTLTPGSNAITAMARTPADASVQHAIAITASGPRAIEVAADRPVGLAPHTVSFQVVQGAASVLGVQADLDGDGNFDSVMAAGQALTFTYTQPGVYNTSFLVFGPLGATSLQTITIVVQDRAALDAQLRAIWGGFVAALNAGDGQAALAFFSRSGRTRYAPVLDALAGRLPAVAASLSPLQGSMLATTVAEYYVTRPAADGGRDLFLVYFLRDVDGVWRLESM